MTGCGLKLALSKMETNIRNISNNSINKKKDLILWLCVAFLLVLGICANYYFSSLMLAFRLVGWMFLVCISMFLIWMTSQGSGFFNFAKNAHIELRKVVWPTRKETAHVTMIVAALVLVMSLLMWGVDSVLLFALSWLTGKGGAVL